MSFRRRRVLIRASLVLGASTVLIAGVLWGQGSPVPEPARHAALALPSGERADLYEWDSFLTYIVKKLGQDFSADQKEQIGELFLDARYQIVQALYSGSSDPVPRLFFEAWKQLSPLVRQAIPGLSQEYARQYSSFTIAMDGVVSLGGIGQQLGFVRITPEVLRGAASLLGKTDVDPLAYGLDVDGALRALVGLTGPLPTPRPSPLLEQGRLPAPATKKASAPWRLFWAARNAHAAEPDFSKLNEWVPEHRELPEYLAQVRDLLAEAYGKVLEKSNLAPEFYGVFKQTVLTTAWQESCWRQFIKKGQKLAPLSSVTGDLGLMQVNKHVWRGLYDIKGLSGDIEYNGHAGAEILMRYLARYAVRNNEHKQPGGHLARATYAAYNGGPSQMTRYRAGKQIMQLKEVDDAFWKKFQAISSGRELAVKSCYGL